MTNKTGNDGPEKVEQAAEEIKVEVAKKAPRAPANKKQEKEAADKELEVVEELITQRIYVGPGKPGLITNTVYADGYPLPVAEMIAVCPAIEKLMVKIAEYPEARRKVTEKGTLEYANAAKVLEFFKKGDKN